MATDIRKLKTYVISLADASDRRTKMSNLLSKIGVENWSFFNAIDVRGKFPYWIGCGLSHRELLAQAEFPCVIYEDDIAPTKWFRHIIDMPDDKIVYFGISKWGTKTGSSNVDGVSYFESDYNESLGVQHLLSTHAIYYPNKTMADIYANKIAKQLFESLRPLDELFAEIQTEEEIYCLKQPIFYQDCEKNAIWTNFEVNENDIIQ